MLKRNIFLGVGASLLAGLFFYIYNRMFPQGEEIEISRVLGTPEKKMVRENIFGDGEFIENEFDHSLLSKDKWSGGGTSRQKIEETLAKLVKKRLGEKFSNNNVTGRIYYELGDLSLEVYVMWKNSPLSGEYSHYDRFEIVFTQ